MKDLLLNLKWIMQHPAYLPEFARKLKYRMFLRNEIVASEAVSRRLATISVTEEEAFLTLFGKSFDSRHYEECYQETYAEALHRVSNASEKLGGPAAQNFLYNTTKAIEAKIVIETGVAYGWSSLAILLAIHENGGGSLESIDFPQLGTSGRSVGLAVPEFLKKYWNLHIGPDRKHLPLILADRPSIDACHYDSDKSEAGRKFAYPLLWNSLRDGGIFISDDIGDNNAFVDFADAVRNESISVVIGYGQQKKKFIGVLKKVLPLAGQR